MNQYENEFLQTGNLPFIFYGAVRYVKNMIEIELPNGLAVLDEKGYFFVGKTSQQNSGSI